MPVAEINCSALSFDEDEATATTWWATSLASRALGSLRRSRTNAAIVSESRPTYVQLGTRTVRDPARRYSNPLALVDNFLMYSMSGIVPTHDTPSNCVRHGGSMSYVLFYRMARGTRVQWVQAYLCFHFKWGKPAAPRRCAERGTKATSWCYIYIWSIVHFHGSVLIRTFCPGDSMP